MLVWALTKDHVRRFNEKKPVVFSQPTEAAEGFVGSTAESCGSHLLHQLPGCRGRKAAEDH